MYCGFNTEKASWNIERYKKELLIMLYLRPHFQWVIPMHLLWGVPSGRPKMYLLHRNNERYSLTSFTLLPFFKSQFSVLSELRRFFEQDKYECLMTDLQSIFHNPWKIKINILYRFYDKPTLWQLTMLTYFETEMT